MIGLSKVVLPLLAPYALAAAGVARAQWDAYRAARLGVTPVQLNAYSGRGGALHARIDQLAASLDDLDDGAEAHATTAARRFAREYRPRLEDLALAVRAAEQMPPQRRRAAHRAVSAELDRIELTLLDHLGVGQRSDPEASLGPHEQRRVERHRSAVVTRSTARRLRGATRPALGVAGGVTCRWAPLTCEPWTTGPRAGPACCAGGDRCAEHPADRRRPRPRRAGRSRPRGPRRAVPAAHRRCRGVADRCTSTCGHDRDARRRPVRAACPAGRRCTRIRRSTPLRAA